MPSKPKKGQSTESYMSSCVRSLKSEGKPPKKAADICFAALSSYRGKSKKKGKGSKKS